MADPNHYNYLQFFTATILEWKHLMSAGKYKIQPGFKREIIQMRFLKFTGQQMKFELMRTGDAGLPQFFVNAKDRQYQIWERNSLSIDLWTQGVFDQKLNYNNNNPIEGKWSLASCPEEYTYSSAKLYETGIDDFGLLTHYYD